MQYRSRIRTSVKVSSVSNLRLTAALALALNAALLAGCGGGSGTSRVASKTPTKAVKAHIRLLQTQSLRALAQSGVANSTLTAISGGSMGLTATASAPGYAAGGDTSAANNAPVVPLTGQFLSSIANANHTNRAVAIRRMQTRHTAHLTRGRERPGGTNVVSDPPVPAPGSFVPDPLPPVTFYYDDYLGLWVDIMDTATASAYSLYADQAKTQPAGSITSTFPTDNTFPQTYTSTYTYTAGAEAGSRGTYTSVYNQDNSGSTSYLDVYTDGGKDQGSSSQTAAGDYTWTGRTDNADKSYTSQRGTFHADGSGSTHSDGSDGYVYDVTYRADGSGHGRIAGPDPGLPATIDWDMQGDTTIVYADGSTEYTPGWGYGNVIVSDSAPGGGGTTTGGTVVNVTTTTTAPPTPPRVSRQTRKTAQ